MDAVQRQQLTIIGADGRIIPVDSATFQQTHRIVEQYYSDYFEIANLAAAQRNAALVFRGTNLAATQVLSILQPLLTGLSAAWHQLSHGDAFRVATYVGPLIGHFTALEAVEIPGILAGVTVGLRAKKQDLKRLVNGLTGMAERVGDLDRAAVRWKQQSPAPSYRRAVARASEGLDEIMDQLEAICDAAAPGRLDQADGFAR